MRSYGSSYLLCSTPRLDGVRSRSILQHTPFVLRLSVECTQRADEWWPYHHQLLPPAPSKFLRIIQHRKSHIHRLLHLQRCPLMAILLDSLNTAIVSGFHAMTSSIPPFTSVHRSADAILETLSSNAIWQPPGLWNEDPRTSTPALDQGRSKLLSGPTPYLAQSIGILYIGGVCISSNS